MIEHFKGQPLYSHINLEKGERSDLAELASNLLQSGCANLLGFFIRSSPILKHLLVWFESHGVPLQKSRVFMPAIAKWMGYPVPDNDRAKRRLERKSRGGRRARRERDMVREPCILAQSLPG